MTICKQIMAYNNYKKFTRISEKNHKFLKSLAKKNRQSIAKTLDEIISEKAKSQGYE